MAGGTCSSLSSRGISSIRSVFAGYRLLRVVLIPNSSPPFGLRDTFADASPCPCSCEIMLIEDHSRKYSMWFK